MNRFQGSAARLPRSITAVRAMAGGTDPATVIRNLQVGFESFKSNYDQRLGNIEAATDGLSLHLAATKAGAGQRAEPQADPEYSKLFASFIRSGDRETDLKAANRTGQRAAIMQSVQASMSVGSAPDGGYLAPAEWDRTVNKALMPISPMRQLATVAQTGVNAFSKVWNARGWGSGWVGETSSRPETTGATLATIPFGHGEIYASPSVTQRLLDDADINIEQFISNELAEEFAKQEGIAFVAGNGTNKPFGFLTYATGAANAAAHPGGAILVKTVASASIVTTDELVEHTFALSAPYRQNASWLMSSATGAMIAKLKDGQGNYIWRESFVAGLPSTLLGRPVYYDENMPAIATGAIPIAFGDFRAGYLINDRTGVRILRDPYTAKPYVLFYTTKRVGGGLLDPNAIRVMKMA